MPVPILLAVHNVSSNWPCRYNNFKITVKLEQRIPSTGSEKVLDIEVRRILYECQLASTLKCTTQPQTV